MGEFLVKIVVVGVLWGAWPLIIGKSGLTTTAATFVFSVASFCLVAVFATTNGISLSSSRWWVAALAGFMAAAGCLLFNDVMIKSKPESAAMMFVIMLVIQTAVPAVYYVVISQQFSVKTIAGFIAAIVACVLLSR